MKYLVWAACLLLGESAFAGTISDKTALYDRPATDAAVIEQLDEGQAVEVLSPPRGVKRPHDWLYVQENKTGHTGWIEIDEFEPEGNDQLRFDELNRNDFRIYLAVGGDAKFSGYTATSPNVRLGVDYSIVKGFLFGAYLGWTGITGDGNTLTRGEANLSVGYYLVPKRLYIRAFGGEESASDSSNTGYGWNEGIGIGYRFRFAKHFDVGIEVDAQHFDPMTVTHDTGIPNDDGQLGNALCSIFTLGLASNCGDQTTQFRVPANNVITANLSIGLVIDN